MKCSDLFKYKIVSTREKNNYEHFSDLIASRDFELIKSINPISSFQLGNYSRSTEALLINEICKYSCAALETFLEIKNDKISKKSISWALIRIYYASFFAAHACLKSVGYFVTRLNKNTCEVIAKEAQIYYSDSLKPKASDYLIQYDSSSKILDLKQLDQFGTGGYHEKFWCVFDIFLDIGLSSPLSSQTVFQEEILFIKSLKDNINKNGRPIWLSSMRNFINYRTFA